MDLSKLIKKVKPNISDITIKMYSSKISNLHKLITQSNDIKDLKFLSVPSQILSVLSKKKAHTIKNYLVSIIVVLQSEPEKYKKQIEEYSKEIKKLSENINNNYDENKKSESQSNNWVEMNDIKELVKQYKDNYNKLRKKSKLNNNDLQNIQDYLLLSLYSGIYFEPLRNDFHNMEIILESEVKDMNKEKNYLIIMDNDSIKFVFNKYKTVKSYGVYELPIKSKVLSDLILFWIENNGSDKFLINITNKKPYSANAITKNLNRIFEKNLDKTVSSSLIRHIYISEKLKDNISTKDKKSLAKNMMHSKSVQENVYNKIE